MMVIDKKLIIATGISLVSGFAIGNYIGKIRTISEMFTSLMSGVIEFLESNKNHETEEEL